MAEPVYKKITELDVLAGALDGNETLPVVKSGKTYKRSWANFFGTGWITSLLGAFTAFKAPDADHADDADTVGGEDTTALHNAALLTGNIHLDRIPAELTGKNAATATLAATASACSGNAATATTSAACSGNAATATKLKTARTITISGDATGSTSFDGSGNVTLSLDVTSANTSQACSGNAATATVAASCSGNAATASRVPVVRVGETLPGATGNNGMIVVNSNGQIYISDGIIWRVLT